MAAHHQHRKPRKSRQYPLAGSAVRTASALALVGTATATAFQGTAQAAPAPTPTQIKAEVDGLQREAKAAAEQHDRAREAAARERVTLDRLRDAAVREVERLNTTRRLLGSIAAAQYRAGGSAPGLEVAFTSTPDEYLRRTAFAAHIGDRRAATVASAEQQAKRLATLRKQGKRTAIALRTHQDEQARHKATVQHKLTAAQQLLGARYALRVDRAAGHGTPRAAAVTSITESIAEPIIEPITRGVATTRATRAIAYARQAIGKPYVWGATGPDAFDCSGLTRAAWQYAGVRLPRTTYGQIDSGTRIPRSALAPGDLIFFYSGVSHVGLYIGDGKMIHAPRPGENIRIAPIDEMPFAGATRPG
ncbi:C40 family peptidase [Streptomyces sp. NBC_00690]|uniref:C40 family peptidase n=1 Tax=Streptomyces sp. NBC_00690 TaxID=2975808 RepID=UPI002E27CCA7|nr:C40 family peptidase [Streptomyces sp. NBC_00690]